MNLLEQVGGRVRELRTARSWTQKQLAERAGMSVRFLGQLEAGGANVSLVRLAEVAQALETSVVSLIEPQAARVKIALVGLRGAGKSTVGSQAATQLAWPFVELDTRVQHLSGMALSDIFEIHGSAGYHRFCVGALEVLLSDPEPAIIEVGGSVVANPQAWRLLEQRTLVVWLRAPAEAHLARVLDQGDTRPMEGFGDALDHLRDLLGAREPLYQRAGASLHTEELGLSGTVAALTELARSLGPGGPSARV